LNKASFNLLIDIAAAVALTALVATGYLLWFVLPPGTNRTHVLIGWMRHEWGSLHAWIAGFLLGVLAVHVALHWRWLSSSLCRRLALGSLTEKRPAIAGMLTLVMAALPLAVVAVVGHAMVRPMESPLHGIAGELTDADARDEGVDRAGRIGSAGREGSDGRSTGELDPQQLEHMVATLLSDRCAGCHGESTPAARVRMNTVSRLLVEQHGVRWVVPADADASPLFRVLRSTDAPGSPAGPHVLPPAELAMLRDWVRSLPTP